jgi:hypothetical protein
MSARVAADAVVLVHLAFVAFVVAGGLFALRDARFALLHLPALAWGVYVEATSTLCPLTPLETRLREAAGESGYAGGFIQHYLIPILYPAGLAPSHQRWIVVGVVAVNALVYGAAILRARRRRPA